MAFDHPSHSLNGIYDFGDAGIGDRHRIAGPVGRHRLLELVTADPDAHPTLRATARVVLTEWARGGSGARIDRQAIENAGFNCRMSAKSGYGNCMGFVWLSYL